MFNDLLRALSGPDAIAMTQDCPWLAARSSSRAFILATLNILLSLTGCGPTTIFQSSFDSNAIGSPPSTSQATGTVKIFGSPNVVIISAPPNATGKDHWAQISTDSSLFCNFSQPLLQNGTYSLTALLLIPSSLGASGTVEFDAFPPAAGAAAATPILSLDFEAVTPSSGGLAVNTVMANDNQELQNLKFPYSKPFTVSVILSVNFVNSFNFSSQGVWSANATVTLFGANGQASGSQQVTNLTFPPLLNASGEAQFYSSFPGQTLDVTDIIVTRKSNGTGPFPPTNQP